MSKCQPWLILPALLWLGACSPALQRHEFSRPQMGTTVRVVLYAPDADSARSAADAAFARIDALAAKFTDYEPTSELARLSATAGSSQAVAVSEDLFTVLERAVEISRLSDGAFDVTVGPAVRLWRRARSMSQLPDAKRILDARRAIGYRHIRLDPQNRTVRLEAPDMRLDLGGIAKGYIGDEALAELQRLGLGRALVDVGGDVTVGEAPPGRPGWRVAIEPMVHAAAQGDMDPDQPRHLIATHLHVATSGDAYQHVVIDSMRYSHILDPRTGIALSDPVAATVIGPDGATADAMASALCVLGPEAGIALADQMNLAAIIVRRNPDGHLQVARSRAASRLRFVSPQENNP